MVVKQCSISGMKSEGIHEVSIMFIVSFIGNAKKDSTSKLTSRSGT